MSNDIPCRMLVYEGTTEDVQTLLMRVAREEQAKAEKEPDGEMDVYFSEIDGTHKYVVILKGPDALDPEYIPWNPIAKDYLKLDQRIAYRPDLSAH